MLNLADTPEPPYTAVILTSLLAHDDGYSETVARLVALAGVQPGFLGVESVTAADGSGITVSYWSDDSSARSWKRMSEHVEAQRVGRTHWYANYRVRVARVERDYGSTAS